MAGKQKTKEVTFKNFKRRTWGFSPVERVKPSKKVYKRKPKHRKGDDGE